MSPKRSMVFRALLLVAIVGFGVVAARFTPLADWLTKDNVLALFQGLRSSWWAPLLLIAMFIVTSSIGLPVSPVILSGGVVFGFFVGSFYNLLGLCFGMIVSYYLARYLGRDFVVHFIGDKLRRVERMFERSGFWPLVQIRFMPIPFAVVNYSAALAGVKAPLFLITSLVGLIPSTLINTYFVAAFFNTTPNRYVLVVVQYLSVLGILNVITGFPTLRRGWRRRARYQQLLETRARRSSAT